MRAAHRALGPKRRGRKKPPNFFQSRGRAGGDRGRLPVHEAASIAKKPEDEQRAIVEKVA